MVLLGFSGLLLLCNVHPSTFVVSIISFSQRKIIQLCRLMDCKISGPTIPAWNSLVFGRGPIPPNYSKPYHSHANHWIDCSVSHSQQMTLPLLSQGISVRCLTSPLLTCFHTLIISLSEELAPFSNLGFGAQPSWLLQAFFMLVPLALSIFQSPVLYWSLSIILETWSNFSYHHTTKIKSFSWSNIHYS